MSGHDLDALLQLAESGIKVGLEDFVIPARLVPNLPELRGKQLVVG